MSMSDEKSDNRFVSEISKKCLYTVFEITYKKVPSSFCCCSCYKILTTARLAVILSSVRQYFFSKTPTDFWNHGLGTHRPSTWCIVAGWTDWKAVKVHPRRNNAKCDKIPERSSRQPTYVGCYHFEIPLLKLSTKLTDVGVFELHTCIYALCFYKTMMNLFERNANGYRCNWQCLLFSKMIREKNK